MGCPSHRNAAFRPAHSIRHPLFAARKYEREGTRPESRCKRRRVAGEMKSEARDHLARGDEQEKWLAWRAAFEVDELLNGTLIERTAKSVDSFGRVREYLAGGEMSERSIDGSLDFLRRPERHDHRLGLHSRKILSASASAKSFSSVILSARSLPRTTTTGSPICSHSAASLVRPSCSRETRGSSNPSLDHSQSTGVRKGWIASSGRSSTGSPARRDSS